MNVPQYVATTSNYFCVNMNKLLTAFILNEPLTTSPVAV